MRADGKVVRSAGWRLLARLGRRLGSHRAALDDADAQLSARKWQSAERAYRRILDRWPEDPDALQGLAKVAFRRRRYRDAGALLGRAATRRPDDPGLHLLRGDAALWAGDHDRAAAAFASALAAGGGDEATQRLDLVARERADTAPPDGPTVLVSFSTPQFVEAQARLAASALAKGGIGRTLDWTAAQLRGTSFHAEHRALLDRGRGAGFWAWKPYITLQAFSAVPEGGYVIYYDCGRGDGNLFRCSVAPIIRWCEATGTGALPGVYIPDHGRNAVSTRRDCFVRMGCDSEIFWNAPQIQATFSVWRHDAGNRAFLRRWLDACTDPAIVSDDPNICGLPNFPDFVEHRCDQSVLTNLCIADGRPAFGRPDEATYRAKDINSTIARIRAAGF